MQPLSKSQSSSVADIQEAQEARLKRWRKAYHTYETRLAAFYTIRIDLEEQIRRKKEYQQELRDQKEDLERYKREVVQKQIFYSKRPVSF